MKIRKNCPCYKNNKDCEFRKKDCHAHCEEFKLWHEEMEKDNAMRKSKDIEYLEYIVPKIDKRRKRKNEKSGS